MKSILLHIYDDSGLESRLQAAFDLARAFEAHLTCVHPTPFEDYLAMDPLVAARLPEEFSEKMKKLRVALQSRVEEKLRVEGVSWDWVHVDEQPTPALTRLSTLSDLVVTSIAGAAVYRDEPRPVAAGVALAAAVPVLAVPEEVPHLRLDLPAVIAWNGSPEAAAAVRAALPLLRLASAVHIVEVEEKPAAYPADEAARYLSRHDVGTEIVVRPGTRRKIGEIVEETALELGAGMIVMGAYGHSRLRELLIGGVTRDLASGSRLPLLLAH